MCSYGQLSFEKTLMLGKFEEKVGKGQQRMRCLDNFTDSIEMNLSKFQEIVKEESVMLLSVGSQRVGHNLVTKQYQMGNCVSSHALKDSLSNSSHLV